MKLSELIEYLQRGLLEHGNVEVFEANYWHGIKGVMFTQVSEDDPAIFFTHLDEEGFIERGKEVNALCVSDSLV